MAEWWDIDGQRREAEEKIKQAADQAWKQTQANVKAIDYNPANSTPAKAIQGTLDETGLGNIDPLQSTIGSALNKGHNSQNQETNKIAHQLGFGETKPGKATLPSTTPGSSTPTPLSSLAPDSSVGPDWNRNYANWKGSQGLEGSLRSALRTSTPKNVGFGLNLEQNPFKAGK